MIAPIKRPRPKHSVPAWHVGFMAMLPAIIRHAQLCFRYRDPEARQDAVQEVVANAMVAYVRLFEQSRIDLAYATVLARYGVAQVRDGRRVGNMLRIGEVLSEYAQRKKGFVVERLDKFDRETEEWQEVLLEDRHAGPAETAAARIDVGDWFAMLRPRDRKIAGALAIGERTMDVAQRFKLSQGRISQKRDQFCKSWRRYQGELPDEQAGATSA